MPAHRERGTETDANRESRLKEEGGRACVRLIECGADVEMRMEVKGNGDANTALESLRFLKENTMCAPFSSTDGTSVNTSHDADASISGGEKSEAGHWPQATETRTHGARERFAGKAADK